MCELTVLMPVFNTRVDWLSEAVNSVLNQSFIDFKFLIIDDGSTAIETIDYLDKLESVDPRITVTKNPKNIGLVATLNRGLTLCSTKWIARMDADDVCSLDRFEKQMEFLKENPQTVVLGTNAKIIETNHMYSRKRIPQTRHEIEATLPFFCCFVHSAIVFNRTEILKLGGYPDVTRAEDYALWLKVLFDTDKEIRNLPQVLMWIRKGINNKPSYRKKIDASGLEIYKMIANWLCLKKLPAFWDPNDQDLTHKLEDFDLVKKAIKSRFPLVSEHFLEKEIIKLKLKLIKKNTKNWTFNLWIRQLFLEIELIKREIQIQLNS